jgi:hypothetical protein
VSHVTFSAFNDTVMNQRDCLCGLVVRIPGYRYQRSRARFLALPDFLRNSGSGTGSTQPQPEELLGRNSSDSGLEVREYGRGELLHLLRDTLYLQTLALTSPTNDGRSVGIVRSWTKVMEFF